MKFCIKRNSYKRPVICQGDFTTETQIHVINRDTKMEELSHMQVILPLIWDLGISLRLMVKHLLVGSVFLK